MKRDRVVQRMRRVMAYVRLYVMEGHNMVHIEQLKTIYELEMGWSCKRTHDKWTQLLVRHGFLSRKNDRVFFITDKDLAKPLEEYGGPQVKLEVQ